MHKADALLYSYSDKHKGMLPVGAFQEIAREVGISRERVRQRAMRLNFTPIKSSDNPLIKVNRICVVCGSKFKAYTRAWCVPECQKIMIEARHLKNWPHFTCKDCGKDFQIRPSANRKAIFCSRSCLGRYYGKRIGFGAFPEHAIWYKGGKK